MPNLESELRRFESAKFGADVKDAFVSCVRKIHAENEGYQQLKEDAVAAADVVQKQAEVIQRSVEAAQTIAAQALEKASNAENDVADDQGQLDSLKSADEDIKLKLEGKVDGAFVENGYLYLTSNNEVVAGPLGPFSGTGGGGTSGNHAQLTVSNISGWLSKAVADGDKCPIEVSWSSVEDEMPTGNGTIKIAVNGIIRAMMDISQGTVMADVSPYLSTGSNVVRVTVSDAYDNSRTINFSIMVIAISISSSFDAGVPYVGPILFSYTPVGSVRKTVHFVLDGKEIGTAETSVSGRQQSFTIKQQKHGAHTFQCYFECEVNGQTVRSNELYYEIICIEALNETPIIVSDFSLKEVQQYTSLQINYTIYDPGSMTSEVVLSVNGEQVSRQTVDRTQQVWTYRADQAGELLFTITSKEITKTMKVTVIESTIHVEAETEGLALYLSSHGRSNREERPEEWKYGEIAAALSGFHFTSDGWRPDDDGITVLRVSGDARVEIPFHIFGTDFRGTGKTIELEFATRDVMNYDSAILSCYSGERGIKLTAQKALFRSEQSEISTQYKEDEHVRITFVVQKRAEQRLIICYINGIMSGCVRYPADDDFSQAAPAGIRIGSNDCTIDLYCLRIYDNDLSRSQVLNNWIADTQLIDDMLSRYRRNSVYDDYGNVVIAQLPSDLPYLILECEELPQYKGDKKTVRGSYTDPAASAKNFTFEGAQADVQGTSSQYYARKNYKLKFKGGFTLGNGTQSAVYSMRPDSVPTDTFTFKADVASSEGANNVELARLYNDICPYKTPPQEADSRIRQGIDGFPIVVFWNNGADTVFLGKYNFNNDKGTEEVFGFGEGDESWEIRNNTSDRVLWKSDDFTGSDWLNDFEARYPEENQDPENLKILSSWLLSTAQDRATGSPLPSAVSYGGVEYTTDTADYRLAKFRAELPSYMEKDAVLFYYLFTELFLMVDSRAKNAFPTAFLSGGGKWFSLPYDFDTAIGINNEGSLVFGYDLEDIDTIDGGADVYNGQQSVLWTNIRQAFFDDIRAMYQELRSTGALSYTDTEGRFEEHQGKWPEAVFNEDAYFKYIKPLIDEGTGAYLPMLQGSKAEQRKWWLYNRFRYIDSKYNAGDALTDVIQIRGYAKADVTMTPYADIYASIKYGSYLVQERARRNAAVTLECPLDNVNDTEIYIYSASQLASVGDLSGLMPGFADFSKATRLQSLKLGDASEGYSNGNMNSLTLGNNVLLKMLDVRNCPNLTQTIDISGCKNMEEAYFDGTSITGVSLPNGGILKVLHLPATVTNLTILNQPALHDLTIPAYTNISTLRLENAGSAVDSRAILENIAANSRVRIIGFSWQAENVDEVLALYDLLDTMRGLDESGNNMDRAQMSGAIHVESVTGEELAQMRERYSDINVTYDHISCYLYYYNSDGSQLLYTERVYDGGDGVYAGKPSKESTAQYTFTFSGWSLTPNGAANEDAQKKVGADRSVYAAYTSTVRTYTVYFYNGSTLLQTVKNVAYGSSASYSGNTEELVDPNGSGIPFYSWTPTPTDIQGDTSCYATYVIPVEIKEIEDSWDTILANVENGTYRSKYTLGNYKALDLGPEGIINMQIVAFDKDQKADGSGTVPISWLSKELLKDYKYINPERRIIIDFRDAKGWPEGTGTLSNSTSYRTLESKNSYTDNVHAVGKIVITATEAGQIKIEAGISVAQKDIGKITCTIDDEILCTNYNGTKKSKIIEAIEGQTITVDVDYLNISTSTKVCGRIKITGKCSYVMTAEDSKEYYTKAYADGTGTVGGWEKCELRKYLQETLKPLLPEEVRLHIVSVSKSHSAYATWMQPVTQTTEDEIWIPSTTETFTKGIYTDFFTDSERRIKKPADSTIARGWWNRDCFSSTDFNYTTTSGGGSREGTRYREGVSFGFCT